MNYKYIQIRKSDEKREMRQKQSFLWMYDPVNTIVE